MSVTIGLEIMTHCCLSSVALRRLNADTVSDQTDDVEGARMTWVHGHGSTGHRRSQLDRIIYTEVLKLNQLTFRHPVINEDTDRPGEPVDELVYIHLSQEKGLFSIYWDSDQVLMKVCST